jgi:hypothetical protein
MERDRQEIRDVSGKHFVFPRWTHFFSFFFFFLVFRLYNPFLTLQWRYVVREHISRSAFYHCNRDEPIKWQK